jgi:hypothetical protein
MLNNNANQPNISGTNNIGLDRGASRKLFEIFHLDHYTNVRLGYGS